MIDIFLNKAMWTTSRDPPPSPSKFAKIIFYMLSMTEPTMLPLEATYGHTSKKRKNWQGLFGTPEKLAEKVRIS